MSVSLRISEAVLNARSLAGHNSTTIAKALSETASEAKMLFRLRLTDVKSSMKIIRIEIARLARLIYEQLKSGRRIDSLLTMAHKSSGNLEMAQKELAVLAGAAESAKEKDTSNDKLDAKIKKTKKKLKSVRKSIKSEGVEASTLQQQQILLAEQITYYKEKKLKVDARLGEKLDAAVNEMTAARAKLKNEEQEYTHIQEALELAKKAETDCKETIILVEKIICFRMKALAMRLSKAKKSYVIITEMSDAYMFLLLCNDASNFLNFRLKFALGRNFEGDYLLPLIREITTLSKGAITEMTTADLFCVAVHEGTISFKRLTQSVAAEAGFKP
ncbi:hypothetical protein OROMI_002890 [Orobanche minor]